MYHTDRWEWVIRAAILTGLAFLLYASFRGQLYQPLLELMNTHQWVAAILRPTIVWAWLGSLLLALRTFLWFRYRPHPSSSYDDAPSLTVIIPAYNEGEMVEKTIDSVASASYPVNKLEIFVVDDGSRDNTWKHIQNAASRHSSLVTAVRFKKNRGKRAALERGFRQAQGEVVVTIDSDSVIDSGTLLAITGPFHDPRVGAVAGRVAVFNRKAGLIPGMLQVRFTLSFDFLRASQSTYGTVYCCPGALAAYRTSIVRAVLDEWMQQTFWGTQCTYGEDRSMTNYILDQGYDTLYQRTAVVHTIVPQTYKKLCKMYLRWDRSYIREEIRYARRIIWKRPWKARVLSMMDILIMNLRFPVAYASMAILVIMMANHPIVLVRFFVFMLVVSGFNMLYFLRSERSWKFLYGMVYSFYSTFGMFWIMPYAAVTLRAKSWLTR